MANVINVGTLADEEDFWDIMAELMIICSPTSPKKPLEWNFEGMGGE